MAWKFVAEWVFETGLYWSDFLQDICIVNTFYEDRYYGFFWLSVAFMVVPPACVWLFMRGFNMATCADLPYGMLQLAFIQESLLSLLRVEKSKAVFWHMAGEGGLEAPSQGILQAYRVLVVGAKARLGQFLASIATSILSTANTYAKLDNYGRGISVFSRAHVRRVCWRAIGIAPRVLGIPLFACLTRPQGLRAHENGQLIAFCYFVVEFLLIWLVVIRRFAVAYPSGVQLFFSALAMVAEPPSMLPSLERAAPAYAALRVASAACMLVVGLCMSPRTSPYTVQLLRMPSAALLGACGLALVSWLAVVLLEVCRWAQRVCSSHGDGARYARVECERELAPAPAVVVPAPALLGREVALAHSLQEAVSSGDAILMELLLREGAPVDGKQLRGSRELEFDLWRGASIAGSLSRLEADLRAPCSGLFSVPAPIPLHDQSWYYEVELTADVVSSGVRSFRVGWGVPGECVRCREAGGMLVDLGDEGGRQGFAAAWAVETTTGDVFCTEGDQRQTEFGAFNGKQTLGCALEIHDGLAHVSFLGVERAGLVKACTFELDGRHLVPAFSIATKSTSAFGFRVNLGASSFKHLLPQGFSPVHDNQVADPPCIIAGARGALPMCKRLLEHRADINSVDPIWHRTMLIQFANLGDEPAMRCLIELRADLWLRDVEEFDALTAAQTGGCCNLVLEAAGDRVLELMERPSRGDHFTALYHAAEHGNAALVRSLLDCRAQINGRTGPWGPESQTPLIWAAARGRAECVKVLIERAADVSRVDRAGCSAMEWAEVARDGGLGGFAKLDPSQQSELYGVIAGWLGQAGEAKESLGALPLRDLNTEDAEETPAP